MVQVKKAWIVSPVQMQTDTLLGLVLQGPTVERFTLPQQRMSLESGGFCCSKGDGACGESLSERLDIQDRRLAGPWVSVAVVVAANLVPSFEA